MKATTHIKHICFFITLFLFHVSGTHAQQRINAFGRKDSCPDSLKTMPIRLIPNNYYSKNIGFFCKEELKLEKTIKIPLRFRLGSLDYCNQLEGKNR